jgi:biofilm PGA synthesis N-glycosyltransferase PgaC
MKIENPSLLTHIDSAQPVVVGPAALQQNRAATYLSVRAKFLLATAVATAWSLLSFWLALPWFSDLTGVLGLGLAIFLVGGIALVPGFMNAFLATSLALDRRPARRLPSRYPALTILIAAYNEEDSIDDTLMSIDRQNYPAPLQVLVLDDGSRDRTAERVLAYIAEHDATWVELVQMPRNGGKARALNAGLMRAEHQLVMTLDGDSFLFREALQHLVERYLSDPIGTRAVAGTMLVRNSRENWVTKAQEWDYFHGISAIKRVQSLYQGTLVAQGAFSLYERKALLEVGGWSDRVGEDIVLTWAMLARGWRVGHAEDACCFTRVPTTLPQFIRQRRRWARGVFEALRQHPEILRKARLTQFFIYWNILFPWTDLAFTLGFIPGIVLALVFGNYLIAGPMTLALLPAALLLNMLMFGVGRKMFDAQGLHVRRNIGGFLLYTFGYALVLQPASVLGYASELLNLRRSWGTK